MLFLINLFFYNNVQTCFRIEPVHLYVWIEKVITAIPAKLQSLELNGEKNQLDEIELNERRFET